VKKKEPKVGMDIIVVKDNKILLLKRKATHSEGTWWFS